MPGRGGGNAALSINRAPAGAGRGLVDGRSLLRGVELMFDTRATGMPLSRYLNERIWKPAGMESDAFYVSARPGPTRPGPGPASADVYVDPASRTVVVRLSHVPVAPAWRPAGLP